MSNKENVNDLNFDSDDGEDTEQPDFSLKAATYFPAQTLGEGSYGAVKLVYDEDGKMFAMKEFEKEKEDVEVEGESDDSEPEEEELEYETMDLGTIREISVLRMFSKLRETDKNVTHPGIMPLHDITRYKGAMCMVMPRFSCTLTTAIENKLLKGKQKLAVLHQLLQTVAFLHKNQVLHRDIKCDNILLDDDMKPVLADFSLAKIINANCLGEGTHTGGLGTATYRAPEVVAEKSYGLASDVFSLGVCFLELFNGVLSTDRDKAAMKIVSDMRGKLSNKPVPAVLKAMLDPDPSTRPSCEEVLAMEAFKSFNTASIERVLNKACMADKPGSPPTPKGKKAKKRQKQQQGKTNAAKRKKIVREEAQLLSLLEITNPFTSEACKVYQNKSGESIEHCMVLASKVYEDELLGMAWAEDQLDGFDADVYAEAELRIFRAMDWDVFI